MRRPVLYATMLATLLAPLFVAGKAEAGSKKPSVSIKVVAKRVKINGPITVTGKVSRNSYNAKVALQRKTSPKAAWKKVKTSKVKKNQSYRFKTTVTAPKSYYRVKVYKNKKIKTRTSKTKYVACFVDNSRLATSPSMNPGSLASVRITILNDTNAYRAKRCRKPLKVMPQMNSVAQNWTDHMTVSGIVAHSSNYFRQIPGGWSRAAENIAAGQAPSRVVDAWIKSPGHRANILGDFNYIGIGYAKSTLGFRTYFTQNLAKY